MTSTLQSLKLKQTAFYRFKMASVAISGEICFLTSEKHTWRVLHSRSISGVRLQIQMKCGLKREYGVQPQSQRCIASLSNHQTRGWIEPSHCGENKSALMILNNFQSPAIDDTPDPSARAGRISKDMQILAFPIVDVFDRS